MSFHTEKLGGHMAAAVSGIDLNRRPIPRRRRPCSTCCTKTSCSASAARSSRRRAVPRCHGAVRHAGAAQAARRTPECAEVNIISSEDRDELGDGKKLVNGASWHTDDSFMREPCSLTMLYGVVVPSRGGDTQFTNMYAAYDALPAETKARIDGLKVIHKYQFAAARPTASRSGRPRRWRPCRRPRIRWSAPIPRPTASRSISTPTAWSRSSACERAESDALLDELIAHATQPKFQYRHVWRQGDIVIWDNRCTMHKANADYPDGERRLMHRVVVAGTAPV